MYTVNQLHEFREPELNPNLLGILPRFCKYCKSPIIINYSMTIVRCSNSKCPKHMSFRADSMFKLMGIKHIGAQSAYKLITANKLQFHTDILALTANQMEHATSREVKNRDWNELQKGRKQTPDVILSICAVDKISDTSSTKIMKKYQNLSQLFEENGNIELMAEHIKNSLGRKEITENIHRMACHLLLAKDDILRTESYFQTVELSRNKISLCLTGDVSTVMAKGFVFSPRENFIKFMNMKYEGLISFVSSGRSLANADFLLTDSSRKTGKYNDAIASNTPIVTFADFARFIEDTYGTGKEEFEIIRRN